LTNNFKRIKKKSFVQGLGVCWETIE